MPLKKYLLEFIMDVTSQRWVRSLFLTVPLAVIPCHLAGLFPAPRAENAKINVTDEPYFGTQIVCNYLPFSKAAKGAQGGPQQYATFERKHSPTDISKRLWSSEK